MIRRWSFRGISVFVIGLLVIAIDQFTKSLVRRHLPVNGSWNPIPWLGRIVTFTHVRNTGAAFGLFPSGTILFAVVAVVVIVMIAAYHRQLAGGSWVLRVAFGLQLGGATGNLVDRIARGYVTDFIDCHVWPVFNVADSSIVVGTALLAYYALFLEPRREESGALDALGEADLDDARGSQDARQA